MSEKFNPIEEARARADIGRQVMENTMERGVPALSVQEHAQGYTDLADYLESRPYVDESGKMHDPVTGKFISKEDADALYYTGETKNGDFASMPEEDLYKSMSLAQLAQASAEAELRGDRTTMLSVDDVIQEKVLALPVKDTLTEKDGSQRTSTERDKVLERVLKLRDSYVKKESAATNRDDDKKSPFDTPPNAEGRVDFVPEGTTGTEGDKKPNPFDQAPQSNDRVVRPFLDKEGRPVADMTELSRIMATKVEMGDESDWNNLVQTMRDQVKNMARSAKDSEGNPVDVEKRLKAFERYARNQYKQLKANREGGIIETPPIDEIPRTVVESNQTSEEAAQNPEKGKRRRKIGMVVGGLLLAGLAAFGIGKMVGDDDKPAERPAVEQEVPVDTGSEADTTDTSANIPINPGDVQPETPENTANTDNSAQESGDDSSDEEVDRKDWTWNVAHQLAPGQEAELIARGVAAYNEANGTTFSLQEKNGTTMIVDESGRIISPAEMEVVNQLIIDATE